MHIERSSGLSAVLAAVAPILAPWMAAALPFTGDLLVQSQDSGSGEFRIAEYRVDGTLLQSFVPEPAPDSSDLWHPRDLVVAEGGVVHLYNGTFDPYLSTYDPTAGSWSHTTNAEWSTANVVSYGGIARFGDRIFVTDMSTGSRPSSAIVVFDTVLGTSQEFAAGLSTIDLNRGLDGKLWVLANDGSAHAFDPVTLAALGSVSMAAAGGDVRALAVAESGDFYLATWDGFVAHLAPDGSLVDTLPVASRMTDIDLATNGRLAVGTWLDGAWLTDTAFSGAQQIESGRWNSFVTFVPEPGTGALLALGLGLLAGRRARQLSC